MTSSRRYYYTYSPLVCILTPTLIATSVLFIILLGKIFIFLFFLPLLITGFYAPIYFEEDTEGFTIRFLLHRRRFLKSEYSYRVVPKVRWLKTARHFGSGGFFGFLGYFGSSELGNFQAFVSDERKPVLLLRHRRTRKQVVTTYLFPNG